MPTNIKCPTCAAAFDVEDVLSADVEQRLKKQYEQQQQQLLAQLNGEKKRLEEEQLAFEEKRRNQNAIFSQKWQQEKQKLEAQLAADKQKLEADLLAQKQRIEAELQQQIRKSVAADYENQLRILQESDKEKEEKLRSAQQKELEFMRKEQELKNREQELELDLQKKLLQERENIQEHLRKEEEKRIQLRDEEHRFRVKDLELQLEEQKKLIEEMKRRAEQGSQQRQGEVQEIILEEMLKEHFPFDEIGEVGKGVEGADCIQNVRNRHGLECGSIIFESKRTKTFNNAWIDKLKADMRAQGADVAILVTQAYPKDFTCFGEKDGVWICSFGEVLALANALRQTIIRVAETTKAEENKGEKMQLLYGYLTGNEFRQSIETIVEGFLAMKNNIMKERIQMEKMWKEREKQLEKVLLSTSGMYGSIKGIAGASVGTIPLLEDESTEEAEEGNGQLLLQ
ncbi:hypothetical protein SAMN05444008_107173 [Cnuella takakiae]|uniref:DUF2130 domain-containing protein n=1 Tax=Cnuella takakiae TaxID=1302690 RepID=A0A1M5B7U0_9BACT|nr:DUF2130 domain-containing protein [Cnuella takakiae]OLY93359.1 hypothetical protein BUE76_16830 [Cnuella takakiae]SHF38252.1 hypothetical protein SAMN05444008_107173 [Cnuella takakiae]